MRLPLGEFTYAAKSWERGRCVVAKLQKPKSKDGAESLFRESYCFVTSRKGKAEEIVSHYLQRSRAAGVFGEFMHTILSNFRHEEMVRNEARAQILAMAFNTLVDLRRNLPREGTVRCVLKLTLQVLIETLPVMRIAEHFGTSDKRIAKLCWEYGIEKPKRGDWTKRKAEQRREEAG